MCHDYAEIISLQNGKPAHHQSLKMVHSLAAKLSTGFISFLFFLRSNLRVHGWLSASYNWCIGLFGISIILTNIYAYCHSVHVLGIFQCASLNIMALKVVPLEDNGFVRYWLIATRATGPPVIWRTPRKDCARSSGSKSQSSCRR